MLVKNRRDLGALLRERRRDLGLTQAEAAERAGKHRTWLVALEHGDSNPTLETLLPLLRSLGLELRVEVAEEPGPKPPRRVALADVLQQLDDQG